MTSSYHHGDLRAALLDAASGVLATEGVAALTLRGLAARVGVSRTAPYRHFADKGALLEAVAADGFDRLQAAVHAARASGADTPEAFVSLAQTYVRFALQHPAHYRLMYGREAISRRQRPALQDAADALYDELVAALTEAQAAGVVRPGDPAPLASVAWAQVHGLAMLLVEGQMEAPDDAMALTEMAARSLLGGLAP
ncbi:MAG: TetR/AcrR family transcriptional regulator [Bacteroidota bacterium]